MQVCVQKTGVLATKKAGRVTNSIRRSIGPEPGPAAGQPGKQPGKPVGSKGTGVPEDQGPRPPRPDGRGRGERGLAG